MMGAIGASLGSAEQTNNIYYLNIDHVCMCSCYLILNMFIPGSQSDFSPHCSHLLNFQCSLVEKKKSHGFAQI